MKTNITKLCADSLRAFVQDNHGIQLKSSYAHELVAAYFGYSSRAALLADIKCPISNLRAAEIIVLSPTAPIHERRKNIEGLPSDLPDDLAEGVYTPFYAQGWISPKIWANFERLALFLADENLKRQPIFNDQKVQREGVRVEPSTEGIRLIVLREIVSPSLLLSGFEGRIGVIDIIDLQRVAGHIGFVKVNHWLIKEGTLEKAEETMKNVNL